MAPLWPSFTPTYHHDQYPAIDPSQPSLDCSSKTILITGGGRGIGRAIALAFAHAHAKNIALLGRTPSTLEETAALVQEVSGAKTKTLVVTADITQADQVSRAFESIHQEFGTVPDTLINNAGGSHGSGALIDVDVEAFWRSYELNTKGPLVVSQAFLRALRAHPPPPPPLPAAANNITTNNKQEERVITILNIPSGAAHIPYMPTAAAYATSKLASVKITEYLHFEHPEYNVFNLQPGVVDTDLARAAGRKAPDNPRLPAGMAVWLTADPRARELNGRFVWANWDVMELLDRAQEVQEKDLLMMRLRGWGEDVSNVTTAEELTRRAKSVHRDADRDIKK